MSLLRIFSCGQKVLNRNSLCSRGQLVPNLLNIPKQRQHGYRWAISCQKLSLGLPNSTENFSTVAKPHITKSLQRWKKMKRKSKAQQKRELEKLQKDFTQLLTKRATQLLREDSLHNRNRQVVTAHTFSNDAILRLNDAPIEALPVGKTALSSMTDELSERLDAHVQEFISNERSDISVELNVPLISHHTEFPGIKKHSVPRENNKTILSSDDIVQKYLNDIPNISISASVLSDSVKGNSHISPLSLSDIYSVLLDSNPARSSHEFMHAKHDFPPHHYTNKVSKSEAPSTSQAGFEFPQSLLAFQTDMTKLCAVDSQRHWESHEDQEEVVPSSSEQDVYSDTAPIAATTEMKKQVGDLIPETELKSQAFGEVPLVPSKKRKERKEHKDFQALIDKSFVDVCCFTGNEMLAIRNIEFQSNRHGISSFDVFNDLVHALAKKQNLPAIKSLFTLFRQWNVSPTLQTFAGCLECVGRMQGTDSFLIERIIADIEKAGYDIADIAISCSFESDEWDYVLKAIHLVDPDFVPKKPAALKGYDNELLLPLQNENPKRLENNQYALDMEKDELMDRLQRQLEMEKAGFVEVHSIAAPSECSSEEKKMSKLREEVKEQWRESLMESFTEKLQTYEKKALDNMWMTVYPYLKLFPPEMYVNIIFKIFQDLFPEAYSPTQAMCHLSLGHAVNRMYNMESRVSAGMADKMIRLYDRFADGYLDKDSVLENHRKLWHDAMVSDYDTINLDTSMKRWPKHVIKMVGKFLFDLLMYDLKIDANLFRQKNQRRLVPAFCTIYRPDVTTFSTAEIKVHPVVSKLFKMEAMKTFQFEPSIVPMLVPPVPWISKNMGGLVLCSYPLIRIADDLYHLDPLKNVQDSQYAAVLDTLNTLSASAWKINKPVLDLQIKIFQSNGDSNLKLSPPSSVLPPLPTIKSDMSSQDKASLYIERVKLQQQKRDMHGLWCSDLYRLSIANQYRDETFWFPHSMDFRGRTYPLPPHFNHLGSDNVRGMLLFAKGKPLGPNGHDWLKIHLINLTGFKKRCSNVDRLAYADSVMDDILDSAEQPLTGRKWWQASDEPWQTLACCMELAKIEKHEGNKEDYVCHFPVHQDGSCNGLQHYAALGRDQTGAESVNLVPFNEPQDVYSDVVELVERERKRDAEDGHAIAIALGDLIKRKALPGHGFWCRKSSDNFFKRDLQVIKQTIMTTVYGVTRYGAKAQIHKQLKDLPDLSQDEAWKASLYLTEKTFSSLREMFTATKDIQDWLTAVAQQISILKPVEWVTPLGFPVYQPYFKRAATASGRNKYTTMPNPVKQRNAFPPNYIHSLDSTHMMLTSLYCMHEGITFVSVHDCFWTHASDVAIMNRICREQFVNMHSQPLLENLSEHLLQQVDRACTDPSLHLQIKKMSIPDLKWLLSNVPKRGTFDLNDVLKSTYFFS